MAPKSLILVVLLGATTCLAAVPKLRKEKCLPVKGVTITDFGLAMHGFDPFKASGIEPSGNPGIMDGEIFDYECAFGKGYRNFISFRSDLNCEASMKTEAYRSVKGYSAATSGSSSSSLDVEVEASGSAFGFSVEASAQYASSRESSSSDAISALKTGEGEVFVTSATCFTHDVSVDTFSRVKFSQNFVKSLLELNKTLDQAPDKQIVVFRKFMKTFGTHFVKKAELGAVIRYQKIFKKKSKTQNSENTRKECMSESAGGCVSASYEGAVAKASAKACVNAAMNACQNRKGSQSSEIEDSVGSFSIVSRGSRPKTLDEWLESEFKPIPIRITALPLIKLLTRRNLAASAKYGFPTAIDEVRMQALFITMYKKYCMEILGLSQIECNKNMTGCAELGDCAFNQVCIDDSAAPKGYRCEHFCPDLKMPGGIVTYSTNVGPTHKDSVATFSCLGDKKVVGNVNTATCRADRTWSHPIPTCRAPCTGKVSNCCSSATPCEAKEGDCDHNSDCKTGLTCGTDNCPQKGYDFVHNDDCCH